MKKLALLSIIFMSLSSFADISFDYRPYSPINCKNRNAQIVNQLIPFLITQDENQLSLNFMASLGKCESGRYIRNKRASLEMYDSFIIAGRTFSPFRRYPAQVQIKALERTSTDLLISIKIDKNRIFRKYNYMDFDFDLIFYPDYFSPEKIFRWYLEIEKIDDDKTQVKLSYR